MDGPLWAPFRKTAREHISFSITTATATVTRGAPPPSSAVVTVVAVVLIVDVVSYAVATTAVAAVAVAAPVAASHPSLPPLPPPCSPQPSPLRIVRVQFQYDNYC